MWFSVIFAITEFFSEHFSMIFFLIQNSLCSIERNVLCSIYTLKMLKVSTYEADKLGFESFSFAFAIRKTEE